MPIVVLRSIDSTTYQATINFQHHKAHHNLLSYIFYLLSIHLSLPFILYIFNLYFSPCIYIIYPLHLLLLLLEGFDSESLLTIIISNIS